MATAATAMPNATLELLEEIKEVKGVESDYGVAKLLKIRPQTISNWRKGVTQMSEEVAFRTAHMLGKPPGPIFARLAGERSKHTHLADVWFEMAGQIPKRAR